jgi:hypothetical protein
MRFRIKALTVLLIVFIAPGIFQNLRAQNYVVDEMIDENATAMPPFSIARVDPIEWGLRLFISTNNPSLVSNLLASGALRAQLSDHQAGIATPVSLSLGMAVWCSEDDEPIYQAYTDSPNCDDQPPAQIAYFFDVFVVLGPNRDLAIGQDPDFLWLIEESW